MKYDIIIPSFYRADKDYTELCVQSLRDSGFDGSIIVVTNGTSALEPLNVKALRLHIKTQGQANATNIGVQLATNDYIMVSNSDMYYVPGWDKNLRFDYPVFSPNLIEPINNAGSAPPFLKLDGGLTLEEFNRPRVDGFVQDTLQAMEKMKEPTEETGFNLPFFIKRDFWNFLGGYDTNFDPWGSNSDTCLQTRINLAGITPMRLRDVLVYHFGNKSGTFDGTHQDYYQHNIDYFRQKFGFDRDELGSDVWMNKDMLPTDPTQIKYKQKKYAGL